MNWKATLLRWGLAGLRSFYPLARWIGGWASSGFSVSSAGAGTTGAYPVRWAIARAFGLTAGASTFAALEAFTTSRVAPQRTTRQTSLSMTSIFSLADTWR